MDGCVDPIMPATLRFPTVSADAPHSDEPRSAQRPYVLRNTLVPPVVESKHRTASKATRVPSKTHRDNKVDDDSYTVPDD
jgi:hypothetical protein